MGSILFLNMGNTNSVKLSLKPEEIKYLEDDTGFTIGQIRSLHYRFSKLDYGSKGYLEREDMLNIPELAINPLGDRIVHAFFCQADNQGQGEEKLSFKDFVMVLAVFQPLHKKRARNKVNTRRNKLLFSFRMFDLDGDGDISKAELVAVLSLILDGMEEEELNKISKRFIDEIDKTQDDLISFDEFVRAMEASDVENKMSTKFMG